MISVCVCVYVYIYPSIHLYIYTYIHLSIYPSIHIYIYEWPLFQISFQIVQIVQMNQYIYPSVYPPIYLSIHLFIVYQSIHLSIYLSLGSAAAYWRCLVLTRSTTAWWWTRWTTRCLPSAGRRFQDDRSLSTSTTSKQFSLSEISAPRPLPLTKLNSWFEKSNVF